MKLKRRHPSIGTEVTSVDLNGPLTKVTIAALKSTWLENPVLIFPNQALSDAAHIEFARHFGDIEIHPSKSHRSSEHPEIYRVSNVLESGEIMEAPSNDWKYMQLTWIWHSDSSFREVPSDGSILHGLEVTREGGETLFCNLYDVWDALDSERQNELYELSVVHSHDQILTHTKGLEASKGDDYEALPPVVQPMVRTHPLTGRKSLFISPHTMSHVVDWNVDRSRELFESLTTFATQDRFVYRHQWQPDDVLLWDNRCTMHAVTPYAHESVRRVMHRVTIAGDRPVQRATAP